MVSPAIVWLRQDLRLADNPALSAAAASGRPVVPVFVLEDESERPWPLGGASRWWLHHSLAAVGASLATLGSPLVLRRGEAAREIGRLAAETGAGAVFWNRRYDLHGIQADTEIMAALKARGIEVRSFNAGLLFEPWQIKTGAGEPFKVFTPFWRACLARGDVAAPLPAPPAP